MNFTRTRIGIRSMRFHHFVMLLLLATTANLAHADSPFLDMTYQEAIKKAGEEKKQVFIDFYTTWCGPCKMLDRTTWKDKKVQTWLKEHTIPLKIDAEKQKDLARKFKIRSYPTMVFIHPDEKVGGRIVGYRNATKFLSEAQDAFHGMTPLKRAMEAVEADPESTMDRYDLGKALAVDGKYKEALEQFKWCWVNGVDSPGFGGVRRSFLLSNIKRLARHYPPAKEQLQEWMTQAHERLIKNEARKEDTGDYASLHKDLGLPAVERVATYDQLIDTGNVKTARSLTFYIGDELYNAKRFEVIGEIIDVKGREEIINHMAEFMQSVDPGQKADLLTMSIEQNAREVEILLILDRTDEANRLLEWIQVLKPDTEHVQIIIEHIHAAKKNGAKNTPSDQALQAMFLDAEANE